MTITGSLKNGIWYLTWDGSGTYSWVVIDGQTVVTATEEKEIAVDGSLIHKTVFVANDNSATYDYWSAYLEYVAKDIHSEVRVVFTGIAGATQYRIKVDGTLDGYVEGVESGSYIYQTSPITATGNYTVDVEYQDLAGNWSSVQHAYTIPMWEVPANIDFSIASVAPGGGTTTLRLTVT